MKLFGARAIVVNIAGCINRCRERRFTSSTSFPDLAEVRRSWTILRGLVRVAISINRIVSRLIEAWREAPLGSFHRELTIGTIHFAWDGV